jgi:hypothetical protein
MLLPFFSKGKKYPVHPWPGPGNAQWIVAISSEKNPICIKKVKSRQGRPVNPV